MKTILVSFFRKKSIYIYIALYTIIFTTSFLLYSFYDYYNNLINSFYADNSYYLLKSDTDISNDIYNKISKNFDTGTLYIPQDINNPLTYVNDDEEKEYDDSDWKSFINMDFDGVLIFKNESNINDEIDISFPRFYESLYLNLDMNYDGFVQMNINKRNYILKIKSYDFKDCYQLNVSNDVFTEILKDSNSYIYKVNPTLKNNYVMIEKKLKKLCDEQKKCEYEFYEYNNYNQLENEEIINTLKKVIICFVIVFVIIFLTLSINIFSDSNNEIQIYKVLGFKKLIIKNILFFKQLIINICSLLLSYLLNIIGILIIKNVYSLNLKIISINAFLPPAFLLIIVLFILCILYKMNVERR